MTRADTPGGACQSRQRPSDPLATAYLETGGLPDAERVYKRISTIDPSFAAAYNGRGVIAIQKQDGATARGYFEKAIQLDPDQVEAQLNLGLIYKMAGDRSRARACFRNRRQRDERCGNIWLIR